MTRSSDEEELRAAVLAERADREADEAMQRLIYLQAHAREPSPPQWRRLRRPAFTDDSGEDPDLESLDINYSVDRTVWTSESRPSSPELAGLRGYAQTDAVLSPISPRTRDPSPERGDKRRLTESRRENSQLRKQMLSM